MRSSGIASSCRFLSTLLFQPFLSIHNTGEYSHIYCSIHCYGLSKLHCPHIMFRVDINVSNAPDHRPYLIAGFRDDIVNNAGSEAWPSQVLFYQHGGTVVLYTFVTYLREIACHVFRGIVPCHHYMQVFPFVFYTQDVWHWPLLLKIEEPKI